MQVFLHEPFQENDKTDEKQPAGDKDIGKLGCICSGWIMT